MSDIYDDLRKAAPEELLAAVQWAFSDASPDWKKGLLVGFNIAREGGWEQVAPGWLRRSKEEQEP